MDIKGSLHPTVNKYVNPTGVFYTNADIASEMDRAYPNAGTSMGAVTIQFQASKNWTGSTSAGTSHNHTFSSSATIGSGNYTRPNSVSCLYIIHY